MTANGALASAAVGLSEDSGRIEVGLGGGISVPRFEPRTASEGFVVAECTTADPGFSGRRSGRELGR